ncbi:MAG: hypothetical protein FWH54_03695 [Methanobrevibacter sp.]|nr:hypothetical protein [Methanobrevibacter sp.]
MKFKHYFGLLIVLTFLIVLLSPVNAFSIQNLDKSTVTYSNGNSYITTYIVASDVGSDYKMKQDLNRISKIVLKVNGKKVDTIKKGKTWNKTEYFPVAIIDRNIKIKGNIKGKKLGIYAYNKNNKLLKFKIQTINSIKNTKFITSKAEAIAIGNSFLKTINEPSIKIVSAKLVNKKEGKLWFLNTINSKTNKKDDTIVVDDETGKIATV